MDVSGQFHALATLPPRKELAGTHSTGGCMGPTASVAPVEKRKISASVKNWTLAIHPVAHHYIDWAIPAHM
jgi:hypothetical protein